MTGEDAAAGRRPHQADRSLRHTYGRHGVDTAAPVRRARRTALPFLEGFRGLPGAREGGRRRIRGGQAQEAGQV